MKRAGKYLLLLVVAVLLLCCSSLLDADDLFENAKSISLPVHRRGSCFTPTIEHYVDAFVTQLVLVNT